MGKTAIDYSRNHNYKLCCKDVSITDVYVGSTTNITKRKNQHKLRCTKLTNPKSHYNVYKFIRDNGGWDNWDLVVIEPWPCTNSEEARIRERYWMEQLSATLNTNYPQRTLKEWRDANIDQERERARQYRDTNREHVQAYHKKYKEEHKEKIDGQTRAYTEANRETIKAKANEYYHANREAVAARSKVYREKNKEKLDEKRKQYYYANREKALLEAKEYAQNNREKVKEYKRQYFQRQKEARKMAKSIETVET